MLDGMPDGNFAAEDATAQAAHFSGSRTHRRIPHAGHHLPQEQPNEFASAVIDVAALARAGRRPAA
jgi:pimeloyl-ACP methyl ester carboxylesterase